MAAPAKHSRCSLPWTRDISSPPPFLTFNVGQLLQALLRPRSHGSLDVGLVLPATAPGLGRGVAPPGRRPWPQYLHCPKISSVFCPLIPSLHPTTSSLAFYVNFLHFFETVLQDEYTFWIFSLPEESNLSLLFIVYLSPCNTLIFSSFSMMSQVLVLFIVYGSKIFECLG